MHLVAELRLYMFVGLYPLGIQQPYIFQSLRHPWVLIVDNIRVELYIHIWVVLPNKYSQQTLDLKKKGTIKCPIFYLI